jgi:hypothetical protein
MCGHAIGAAAGYLALVVQGFVINRLAGIPYPVWSPRPAEP